ncbi:MAG: beta-propeller domain-containing protein [Candidatus Peribacteria bacterium]|nr:beta-propeller domain-containing protein [Candidatus Peribacteria bacterium]
MKTFVINYDVANVDSPKLEKIYIVDGSLVESRKIGDYVYVISNNYFSVPYYAYNTFDDADFSISKIMPQKIDVSVNSATSKYTMDT